MGIAIAAQHMNMNDARLLVRDAIYWLSSTRRHFFFAANCRMMCSCCPLAPWLFTFVGLTWTECQFYVNVFFLLNAKWCSEIGDNQPQTLLLYSHTITYVYLKQMTNHTRVCNYKGIFNASVPYAWVLAARTDRHVKKTETCREITNIDATPPFPISCTQNPSISLHQ